MGRLGFDMSPVQSSVLVLPKFLLAARQAKVPIIFIATQHSERTNSQAWLMRGPRRGGEICAVSSWGALGFSTGAQVASKIAAAALGISQISFLVRISVLPR